MTKDLTKESLFTPEEVDLVVLKHEDDCKLMRTATNITQWNNLRENIINNNRETHPTEMIILLGHIDGVIHSEVFGK
jgi:hypothetical protein